MAQVLPVCDTFVWRRWPPRLPDNSKGFSPRAGHAPGNIGPTRKRLLEVWADVWSPVLESLSDFTNEVGMSNNAAGWVAVDVTDMMRFHAAVLRMSMVRRNQLKDYFRKKDGDEFIKKLNFRERFFNICNNLSLYSPKQATAGGHNNSSDKENFDSLFSIRPVWELTFQQFQKWRNPPELIVIDEAMSKYTASADDESTR